MNFELLITALYPQPFIVVNGKLFTLSAIERVIETKTGVMIHFISGGSMPLDKQEIQEFEKMLKSGIEKAKEIHARAAGQIVVPTITGLKGN